MKADEVVSVLTNIRRIRPNLFENIEDEETYAILEQWQEALAEYDIEEFDSLASEGYYFQHFNYTDKVLTDLLKALDEQRYEHTPEGIAEKERLLAEFYSRHPQ